VAAAVVPRDGSGPAAAELREFLLSRIADFKVPSQIVLVDQIPKGPTGKVQRIGLAEKLADRLRTPYVAPRSALEAVVAAVYAEVLRLDKVGALDSFFVLGGDSLKATQVVSRLQALLPLSLPIVTVFQKPGVAELANAVGSLLRPDDLARLERSLAVGDAAGLGGSPDERVGGGSGGIQRIPRGGGRREGSD
jgi:acyl carrier protein